MISRNERFGLRFKSIFRLLPGLSQAKKKGITLFQIEILLDSSLSFSKNTSAMVLWNCTWQCLHIRPPKWTFSASNWSPSDILTENAYRLGIAVNNRFSSLSSTGDILCGYFRHTVDRAQYHWYILKKRIQTCQINYFYNWKRKQLRFGCACIYLSKHISTLKILENIRSCWFQ